MEEDKEGRLEEQLPESSVTHDSNYESRGELPAYLSEYDCVLPMYWPPGDRQVFSNAVNVSFDPSEFEKEGVTKTPGSIWVGGYRKVGKTTLLASFLLHKYIVPLWTGSGSGGGFFATAKVSFPGSDQFDSPIVCPFWRESVLGSGEMWVRLRPLEYPRAHPAVFVLLFSIGSRKSFEELPQYLHEYRNYNKRVPILLVGAKSDLRDPKLAVGGTSEDLLRSYDTTQQERSGTSIVSREEAEELVRQHNLAGYLECSSRTGEGVIEVFKTALSLNLQSGEGDTEKGGKKRCTLQ